MNREFPNANAAWVGDYYDFYVGHRKLSFEEQDEIDRQIAPKEVAMKLPEVQSIVKISEDGTMGLFVSPHVGILLDPKTESINFIGDRVNFFAGDVNLQTKDDGVHIQNKTLTDAGWKDKPARLRYSDGMIQALQSLGLPAEKEVKP